MIELQFSKLQKLHLTKHTLYDNSVGYNKFITAKTNIGMAYKVFPAIKK